MAEFFDGLVFGPTRSISHDKCTGGLNPPLFMNRLIRFIAGCVVVGGLGGLLLGLAYGSVGDALARLRGNDLVLVPDEIDIGQCKKVAGEGAEGEKLEGHFAVKNLGSREVLVTGARIDCGCVRVTSSLPFSLAPGEDRQITFEFAAPRENSPVSQSIILYTSSTANPELTAVVAGLATR